MLKIWQSYGGQLRTGRQCRTLRRVRMISFSHFSLMLIHFIYFRHANATWADISRENWYHDYVISRNHWYDWNWTSSQVVATPCLLDRLAPLLHVYSTGGFHADIDWARDRMPFCMLPSQVNSQLSSHWHQLHSSGTSDLTPRFMLQVR